MMTINVIMMMTINVIIMMTINVIMMMTINVIIMVTIHVSRWSRCVLQVQVATREENRSLVELQARITSIVHQHRHRLNTQINATATVSLVPWPCQLGPAPPL